MKSGVDGTISGQWLRSGGHSSGFDYLRITLSCLVITIHTVVICYGQKVDWDLLLAGPWRPLHFFVVPSFFALSGFLVAGSLERNTLPAFLTLRVLRIFPALTFEILLSAFLIGPLLTVVPLSEYFGSRLFFKYLLNCNIAVAVLALIGVTRRRTLFVGLATATALCLTVVQVLSGSANEFAPANSLIFCFLFGVLLYQWREQVPCNRMMFLFALAVYAMLVVVPQVRHVTPYLSAIPITYITVYLGVQNPRRLWLISSADYSYDMYLFGWPVQQVICQLLPHYRIWYINLFLGLLFTAGFAFVSWNLVESRVLARKQDAIAFVASVIRRIRSIRSSELPQGASGGSFP